LRCSVWHLVILMIQSLNEALNATAQVFVLEDGVIKIIGEIDREITGEGGKLIVLTGPPGVGVTTALDHICAINKRSVVRMRPSIYLHSPGFLERLIESFGMTIQGGNLKKVPRYLVEILNMTQRKIIVMDDFDVYWQSIEDVRRFCSEISNLFKGCSGINIVVSTRANKVHDWLVANNAETSRYISIPSATGYESTKIFSEKYANALSLELNWRVSLPEFKYSQKTILEIARTIRTATIVAFLRGESVLDLDLHPRKGDDYVLRRYLEIAATA